MKLCIECGRPESEHCVFVGRAIPEGCKCGDDGSWGDNIKAICAKFEPLANEPSYCVNCEHDEACHATPNTQATATAGRERK